MPDVEAVQASTPQVMKRDLTIRVGTVRNHNYYSSKTVEMPYHYYLLAWVQSRQWDKCTVRISDKADSRQTAISQGWDTDRLGYDCNRAEALRMVSDKFPLNGVHDCFEAVVGPQLLIDVMEMIT